MSDRAVMNTALEPQQPAVGWALPLALAGMVIVLGAATMSRRRLLPLLGLLPGIVAGVWNWLRVRT
ncbi:MAG: hypothetical protein K0U69_09185 [Actinomycetia bacterium]|nr:hypothetical protein [Actinomycetes bacterium]MCH9709669.1 hypothetical protein [Actinomycetes bacterium]